MKKLGSVLALLFVIGFADSAFAQIHPAHEGIFLRLGVKNILEEPASGLVDGYGWRPGFEMGVGDIRYGMLVIGGYFGNNVSGNDTAVGNIGIEAGPRLFKVGGGYSFSNDKHLANTFYGSVVVNAMNLYVSTRIGFFNRYADVNLGLQFGDK